MDKHEQVEKYYYDLMQRIKSKNHTPKKDKPLLPASVANAKISESTANMLLEFLQHQIEFLNEQAEALKAHLFHTLSFEQRVWVESLRLFQDDFDIYKEFSDRITYEETFELLYTIEKLTYPEWLERD